MKTKQNLILLSVSIFLALCFGEIAIRIGQRFGKFQTHFLYQARGENFFYANLKPDTPIYPLPECFDPILGWRACTFENEPGPHNSQRWRSTYDYSIKKSKSRVIVLGDSFVYGVALKFNETITHHLQYFLGSGFEVMNMAGSGYGLDQISLAATEEAPKYNPDYVIVAFISDDLRRSCSGGWLWERKKPYFFYEQGKLSFTSAVSPTETIQKHKTPRQRFIDKLWAGILKVRLLNVVSEPFFQFAYKRCLSKLNYDLLYRISKKYQKSKLLFVNLEGSLPNEFVRNISSLPNQTLWMPPIINGIARKLGVVPGRVGDGSHPDSNLNKIYAYAIYQWIIGNGVAIMYTHPHP